MTPEWTVPALLAAEAVIALGIVAQLATGLGFGLVTTPLLLMIDARLVPVPGLLVTILVMLVICAGALRPSPGIGRRVPFDLRGAALASVPGSAVGVWVSTVAGERLLDVATGLVIVVGTLGTIFGWALPQRTWSLAGAGFVGGVFGSLAATPGPPVALVYRCVDLRRLRTNLALFFLATCSSSLAVMALTGRLTGGDLVVGAQLLPGVLVGFLVAVPVVRRLSPRAVRRGTLGLCLCSGVYLVARALG